MPVRRNYLQPKQSVMSTSSHNRVFATPCVELLSEHAGPRACIRLGICAGSPERSSRPKDPW